MPLMSSANIVPLAMFESAQAYRASLRHMSIETLEDIVADHAASGFPWAQSNDASYRVFHRLMMAEARLRISPALLHHLTKGVA